MASRIMKILGILGSIDGIGIIMYGVTSYNNQKGLASALKGMFGTGDASHAISRMSDFKVVILIGIVLLIVSLIIVAAGFLSTVGGTSNNNTIYYNASNGNNGNLNKATSNYEKLSELQKMRDADLITEEEFVVKKKEIIDNI